jgi:hypothetical protein
VLVQHKYLFKLEQGGFRMKRRIYDGCDTERFVYGQFRDLMRNLGAEPVKAKFNLSPDKFQVWFLNDVTVRYVVEGGMNSQAVVDLFGSSDEKISEVEKIILED